MVNVVLAYRKSPSTASDGICLKLTHCTVFDRAASQSVATTPAYAYNRRRSHVPSVATRPCECPKEPCPVCGQRPCVCKKKAKVKLADGKERVIQHMVCTTFWHSGRHSHVRRSSSWSHCFGKLAGVLSKTRPSFVHCGAAPDTRKMLLNGLAEKGLDTSQLAEMQKIIRTPEKSDLFDVLALRASLLCPRSRAKNAPIEQELPSVRTSIANSRPFWTSSWPTMWVSGWMNLPRRS